MSRMAAATAAEENRRSPSPPASTRPDLQRSGSPLPLSPPPLSPLPLGVPRPASVARAEENPRSASTSVSPSPDLTRSASPPPLVVSRPPAQAPAPRRNPYIWRLTPRRPKNRVRGAKISYDEVVTPPRPRDVPPPPMPPPLMSGDAGAPTPPHRRGVEEIPGGRRLPGSFDPNPFKDEVGLPGSFDPSPL